MTCALIYSDHHVVPQHFDTLVGAERFGDIIFRRQTIHNRMELLAEDIGIEATYRTVTPADISFVVETIQRRGYERILHVPSWLAVGQEERARDRLRRLTATGDLCRGTIQGKAHPFFACSADHHLSLLPKIVAGEFPGDHQVGHALVNISLDGAFVDISDIGGLIDLLSGALTSRHFNSVTRTRHIVVKKSSDVKKIKAEHDFYYLLPHETRRWFVAPYDLQIQEGSAQYKMERLYVLDMGQQWINGSVTPDEFSRFLEDVLSFFEERPARKCSRECSIRHFDKMYIEKVKKRYAELMEMDIAEYLDAMIRHGTQYDSLGRLFDRYFDLVGQYRSSCLGYEVIGHGDPCFSNILYEKRIRLLKLIDPKGTESKSELYMDPFYDYAKLSHSVFGGYDFITNGFFDITVDDGLRLRLTTPDPNFSTYSRIFLDALAARDIDPRRIRLCEASLFLSMLPLHIDSPRNVLAYLLVAAHILDEIGSQ